MRFICLALAVFIAGCTTLSRQEVPSHSDLQIDSWEIKGRLAARIDRRGETASFIWHRHRDQHSIELYGPLGSGRIFLRQTGGKASLVDNRSEVFGEDLQDVLFKRIGWLIPFDEMQQWIVGRPERDAISDQQYGENGLKQFSESGWLVTYDDFENFSGISLPTRITLTATSIYLDDLAASSGRTLENARVKIVINEFKPG